MIPSFIFMSFFYIILLFPKKFNVSDLENNFSLPRLDFLVFSCYTGRGA
ncbi:hypothetical protein FUSO4_00815 [Fusobacterium necrophorum DJ-1]|uniref:Uncharacterized protein n=1 Tax=Fusobacterium necrophorum DJ-2 TaxID=1441737 RepID=A0AB73C5U5_9FUSO|nr:hypothetical protein FUSO5_04040 [Fusobacterium necrophorum BFTR-1]KDE68352.1 hypothetical protein FUSO4_00815 [Fusobacterium necrophorum DJ-1]KDE69728.1 hypothetical protein FUSO6_05895 [Fusobacterium necrophorum DAB]KDE73527.1 hypothetical protein FUSO8_00985 [Fusobacterium necrophorum DJ-2]